MQKTFTLEEVQSHNKPDDAWLIIDGVVYDITKFAKFHPGGSNIIMEHKGKDASKVFWDHHHYVVLEKYRKQLQIGLLQGYKIINPNLVETENTFGNLLPFTEPHWYQGQYSPYYNESHAKYRIKIRKFLQEEWIPFAYQYKDKHDCPRDVDRLFAKIGLNNVMLGTPWNNKYFNVEGPENYNIFHQQLAYYECFFLYNQTYDAIYGANKIGLPAVYHFGNDYLKDWILPQVLSGEKRICLAVSEPFGASDVANLRTTAVKDGEFFIVNGAKKWITGGCTADYFTTAVRTGGKGAKGLSMLLIERNTPGFKIKALPTQGGDMVSYLTFENCKVPVKNLIGTENQGWMQIMYNFNPERLEIVVGAIALSRWCLRESLFWAIQRDSFGKKLHDHQAVRMKLANMAKKIEALSAWTDQNIYQLSKMEHFQAMKLMGDPIALLKVEAGQTLEYCAREATHIFGGSGLVRGGPGQAIEQIYRSVGLFTLTGGAEDVLLDYAARQLIKKGKKAQAQLKKLQKDAKL